MKILWAVMAVGIVAPIWIINATDVQKNENQTEEQAEIARQNREAIREMDDNGGDTFEDSSVERDLREVISMPEKRS